MPRSTHKTLTFPLAGVLRRGGYREQSRPYSAPWAVNVRGVGAFEGRERGGSRPGLVKVCATGLGSITAMVPVVSVDPYGERVYDLIVIADGVFYRLQGDAVTADNPALSIGGEVIVIGGEEIVFPATVGAASLIGATDAYSAASRAGKLYLADSLLREYDPQTGAVFAVMAVKGDVPYGQPVTCMYRDRIFLTGENHAWYASRQGSPDDWGFGADMGDAGRAVAGQLAFSGEIGETPKAMIPVEDKALVFACENSLWVLRGDPATGRLERASAEIGVIAPNAWAMSADGVMAFLSNDGVYVWTAGSGGAPVRFSEGRIPDQLRNVDPATNTISMAYDPTGRGFHLFITPSSGMGLHWWLDVDNKALWPVRLQASHQPLALARVEDGGLADVVLGCGDGYLRKFSAAATSDDWHSIESHVLIGPVRIAADDVRDAMLAEIHGIMADADYTDQWDASVSAGVLPDSITVSGAGITAVNGVYGFIVMPNNEPQWRMQGIGKYSILKQGVWIIHNNITQNYVYLSSGAVDSSPTNAVWDAESNPPAPVLTAGSGVRMCPITWRVVMGDSAEAAVDTAVAAVNAVLDGDDPVGVAASGLWKGGRNHAGRPRCRGAWCVVWVSARSKWAHEATAIVARQLGRIRI